jgi:hypothetical protein
MQTRSASIFFWRVEQDRHGSLHDQNRLSCRITTRSKHYAIDFLPNTFNILTNDPVEILGALLAGFAHSGRLPTFGDETFVQTPNSSTHPIHRFALLANTLFNPRKCNFAMRFCMKAPQLPVILSLITASSLLILACGSGLPSAPNNGDQSTSGMKAPAVDIFGDPDGEGKGSGKSANGAAKPATSADPEEDPKSVKRAGAPMAVYEDEKEHTAMFGVSGGKIIINSVIELYVPADSLKTGYNFTVAINDTKKGFKFPPYKGQIGTVYRLAIQGKDAKSASVTSAGDSFAIKIKLPKGKETGNLVMATPVSDSKGKYKVVAPTKTQTADDGNTVVFEMATLPGSVMLHLTSAAP